MHTGFLEMPAIWHLEECLQCQFFGLVQAVVLKYLLFVPDEGGDLSLNMVQRNIGSQNLSQTSTITPDNFSFLTEHQKTR